MEIRVYLYQGMQHFIFVIHACGMSQGCQQMRVKDRIKNPSFLHDVKSFQVQCETCCLSWDLALSNNKLGKEREFLQHLVKIICLFPTSPNSNGIFQPIFYCHKLFQSYFYKHLPASEKENAFVFCVWRSNQCNKKQEHIQNRGFGLFVIQLLQSSTGQKPATFQSLCWLQFCDFSWSRKRPLQELKKRHNCA